MADPKYVKDFIDQMTPYAVAVGDQYGIDPITIITQAAVETGWGREVAGNNYFGVKSHGQPGGQNITTHEEVNGKRVKVRDNFRSYGSLGESVADYGRFLSENPRYAEALKETGAAELSGIANAGYATSSKYHNLTSNVAGMVKRNIRPLPPGSLPEVATRLDVVPPRTVAPTTMSPDLAQMRRTTPPSRLVQDTFAQLPQRPGSRLADNLALSPIQGGRQTAQPFDAAFDTRIGAMRMLGQPETVSSQGLGVGTSRAPIALPRPRPAAAPANPTKLPALPPSTLGKTPQSAIERGATRIAAPLPAAKPRVTVSTPYTTPQSAIERGTARAVTQSPIGQPPATRVVQSVPMPAISTPRTAIPQSFAGMETGAPRIAEERLPSTPMAGRLAPAPPVVYDPSFSTAEVLGNEAQTIRPTGPLAPIPRATIARAPLPADPYRAVGTALDTAMPALPRPRPNLGMGGVDIPGVISQTGQVAPTPMPRLQRPGIFGRPQLFGRDVPLPGLLGVLQSATMAMNNASGPFNNGGDNALYNGLRGGDFNTPGAATHQAGGFLYAPKAGGGFINVGRVNPTMSAATLYDSRNAGNGGPRSAADRAGKSLSQSGGQGSIMGSAGEPYGLRAR